MQPHTDEKQTILIVDDNPVNLDLLKGILEADYEVKVAINGKTALKITSILTVDLILLDVMMPQIDGIEVCRRLKSNPETYHIPVIFVTAMLEAKDEQQGFDVGAVDYITKPINPGIVKARVKNHLALANQQSACKKMVETKTQELLSSQTSAIHMLGEAGHYNDTDTGLHIWRMAAYSAELASLLNWSVPQVELIKLAAPMHDTGKIGIPDEILKAPRKLTDSEWVVMKKHAEIGFQILSKGETEVFKLAAEIALYHHEKWNGQGYPKGLATISIPESARIIAIADVFDALTMKRPYKEEWTTEQAFQLLTDEAGKHFDPEMVQLFVSHKDVFIKIKEDWEKKEF